MTRAGVEVSILSVVQAARNNAKETKEDFRGLTLFEIQKAMKMSAHSNQIIENKVSKLVGENLLKAKVFYDGAKSYTVSPNIVN